MNAFERDAAARRGAHSMPRVRSAVTLAAPLCAGVVLWLQALHAALGAGEHAEPPWALHWARDAALALPLVVAAVWAGGCCFS
jgi:hypothetical protein